MQVITADLVLAGPELVPVEHGAVLVDGDRIAWVGREADVGGDPHHDLAALHDLRLVLARGEPFTPDPLPPIPPLRREDLPGFAFTKPPAGAPPPP